MQAAVMEAIEEVLVEVVEARESGKRQWRK